MEERKKEEIEHYDKTKEEFSKTDFEGFSPFVLSSYSFLKNTFIENFKGKKVLDYGCGNGIHSTWLENYGEVTGVDLSQNSLNIAKKRTSKAEFIKMDCENLEFPENSFDVVFDGGTFSSLDYNKALNEIIRVLKKDGVLIGIETLGHNPILNLKRRINTIRGKRTKWAECHIFKMEDFKKTAQRFENSGAYFFHFVSWIAFPFLNFKIGRVMLRLLERIDVFLISIFPFLKKYSFKIVFIFENHKS